MTLTENLLSYLPDILTQKGYSVRMFKKATTISGGDINEAYKLTSDKHNFFIKTNQAGRFTDLFDKERKGLEILHKKTKFRIPEVIAAGEYDGQIFLLLEFITTASKKPKPDNWSEKFAQRLAHMHQVSAPQFGLDHNNYIGRLPQSNKLHNSWAEFFVTERLEPQLKQAEKYFSATDRKNFELLFNRIESLVPEEEPALLHGDLWGGNYLIDEKEEPVLIDPAVYYGHREVDIAMMQLFGGFDMEIFHQYQQLMPMEGDWQHRADLHNIYPLLVHANMFGGHYPAEVKINLKKFL